MTLRIMTSVLLLILKCILVTFPGEDYSSKVIHFLSHFLRMLHLPLLKCEQIFSLKLNVDWGNDRGKSGNLVMPFFIKKDT